MDNFSFRNYEDRRNEVRLVEFWKTTNALADPSLPPREISFECQLCHRLCSFGVGGHHTPNFREGVVCDGCHLNARTRAAIATLVQLRPDASAVYMTEQATPAYVWTQKHYPKVLGSEYQPDPEIRIKLSRQLADLGGLGDVEFQDATSLTYADSSLDAVLTLDILEHIPDYRTAILEFARVLKRGGICIATFPFTDAPNTITRAKINSRGAILHLMEPEYHGDPIGGGILCYYHFGWQILAEFRRAGFNQAEMVLPYNPSHGIYYGLWTAIAYR